MIKTNNTRLMKTIKPLHSLSIVLIAMLVSSCVPELSVRNTQQSIPNQFNANSDTTNVSNIKWNQYFSDPYLLALIDTALQNNQELNIFMREMEVLRNEVQIRKGEYLPFVDVGVGTGLEKPGKYTRAGAVEESLEVREGQDFPEPLGDFMIGAYASWEVDVWKKLRNAKKSALTRYLSSIEGRNFLITNLVSEIASAYYELLALDRQLAIVQQNIGIQSNALQVVKVQKQSTKVTELAVKRFEAQLAGTRSLQFDIQQKIIEVENEINYLVGRFPQPIQRAPDAFEKAIPDSIQVGLPSHLLENRPDIRQAELQLAASKLDVQVAKANFYPRLEINAALGYQAFNPRYLIETPESLMFGIAGDIVSPLVNRNAIKAFYKNANERQKQAAIEYEQTILNAYVEVANQIANIQNLKLSYQFKFQQVQRLNESIDISNNLFRSARADYMEVLLTQEDALETEFELVETKVAQLQAWVSIYRALGGGWK